MLCSLPQQRVDDSGKSVFPGDADKMVGSLWQEPIQRISAFGSNLQESFFVVWHQAPEVNFDAVLLIHSVVLDRFLLRC